MALILIRGDSKYKLLNAIADMERHGNFNLITKPKVVDASFADSLVEGILKSKIKHKSKIATAFFVKEETTLSIVLVKKIHPPAHIVVVSQEYGAYSKLEYVLNKADDLDDYSPNRAINDGIIDYTMDKGERRIKNDKLNSYNK